VFAEAVDELRFEEADELSLAIEGPFAHLLAASDDNLILRAARALGARARIVLTKNLPVASGIGGGSADAAAALRALGAGRADLMDIAARIGSDVPVCVASRSSWMEGRGEHLAGAPPIPDFWLVLVNPRVAVPTGQVFAGLERRRGSGMDYPTSFKDLRELIAFLRTTGNDLEEPACKIAPVIRTVLDRLNAEGALLSRMSGSGATCFAMVEDAQAARSLAQRLIDTTDWWVAATALAPRTQ